MAVVVSSSAFSQSSTCITPHRHSCCFLRPPFRGRHCGSRRSSLAMRPGSFVSSRPLPTTAGLEEVYHNHVLVTAVTASVLGQILKPFAAAVQGKGFNWKLAVRAGGMPSTHSAFVTAACTVLALERGLSDSLFGISAVFASIVMYDAQGVRRAVGKQAEVLNMMLLTTVRNSCTSRDEASRTNGFLEDGNLYSFQGELEPLPEIESSTVRLRTGATATDFEDLEDRSSPTVRQSDILQRTPGVPFVNFERNETGNGIFDRADDLFKIAKKLPSVRDGEVTMQELGMSSGWQHIPLKESVGHTKLEVLCGGLWGIMIALALKNFQ